MNVSQWIVDQLIRRGVTTIFALQGGFSMYLNDAIGHSALRPVYMLTEAGAAYAAAGWAQYTGQMGVLVITSGLAQTNALSGVASAYSDYLPMFVLSGDINSDLVFKRDDQKLRQGGQQDVPIDRIARPVTKEAYIANLPKQARLLFERYWNLALTEPRGPVWLSIPLDIQQAEMPE